MFLILNASFLSAVTQIVTKKIIKAFLLSTWPWLGGDSLQQKNIADKKEREVEFWFCASCLFGWIGQGKMNQSQFEQSSTDGKLILKIFPLTDPP